MGRYHYRGQLFIAEAIYDGRVNQRPPEIAATGEAIARNRI